MTTEGIRVQVRRLAVPCVCVAAGMLASGCAGGDSPIEDASDAAPAVTERLVAEVASGDELTGTAEQMSADQPAGGPMGAAEDPPKRLVASASTSSPPGDSPAGADAHAPGPAVEAVEWPSDDDRAAFQSGRLLMSCEELIDGWTWPLSEPGVYGDGPATDPSVLTGEDAVSSYTGYYLEHADLDPWLFDGDPLLDSEARVLVADHLTGLIDADGMFCGLVAADTHGLDVLRQPVPTLPPAGSLEEYTAWALDRCDRANRSIEESVGGMDALLELTSAVNGASSDDEYEDAAWELYMTMNQALFLADSIAERSDVPPAAEKAHALLLEMSGELDRVISSLGVAGPGPDRLSAAAIEDGQTRVRELCSEIETEIDALGR